ncbi:MAG: pilus assembly protein, partial [Gammaproteobacteria bacterium]
MKTDTSARPVNAAKSLLVGVLLGHTVAAGAGVNIPNTPIFLANDIPANVFLALDDSGSMDWEVTLTNGAMTAHTTSPNSGNLDMSPNDDTEDFEHCVGYNIMAYDPAVTYTPWLGVDEDGNAYQDQSAGAALVNPYDADGATYNLLDADSTGFAVGYGLWVDGSGGNPADGIYQAGECPTSTTANGGYNVRAPNYTDPRWVFVDSLTAAQQTNYANWYSYYRKREYVLKRAISELVSNSSQRMGLATLHNNNNVGTPVGNMTDAAVKATLMDQLFNIDSQGGTPLRALLQNTGEYFDQTDSGDSLHSPLGFTDASPILPQADGGECQQNFVVLFSDGSWNGGAPSVGNNDEDGAGPWDGGPHADTFANTLADVAMKYYENDLSTLDNKVPVITNVDENQAQHLVTYSVSFGVDGTLAASPPDHEPTTPPPPWPQPVGNNLTTIDDMRHAAFNSRGLYLDGQDPQTLISSLNNVFTDIGNRTGSASAVAATSQSIQTGTKIFQGFFDTEGWDGDLFGIEFLEGGEIGSTVWNARDGIPDETAREIFTWVDDGTVTGADFEWANLTAAQQADIGSLAVLEYVRGVRSDEVQNGGTLRNRETLLADIIHSTPVAVTSDQSTPPYQLLPGAEGSSFNAYLQAKATREDMVYVGANGGMLHGFRVSNGTEEFAYVPQVVFPNLADLTSTNYAHKFYVDGALQAADVYIGGGWKSVLVGTPGRGGASIFALDVSTPLSFNASDVLWEFTHSELGIQLGKNQVVRLNNGSWAVVAGNGYNSTSEKAQLLIIDLATGNLIRRIDTSAGSAANTNGLATP